MLSFGAKSLLLVSLFLWAEASILDARKPDPFKKVSLVAPDGSARADFIPFGATTTNFWVKDKHGKIRDVLLGFDNHTLYQSDAKGHPYFGPIVGRYANRIKNGTFSIPISKNPPPSGPNVFHVPENENNGTDTLHGGTNGFDRRVWSIAAQTKSSVTFTLVDPDGTQGFPGTVHATVQYTLAPHATWNINMHATATKKTPIMLSGHHYWNLEAYEETQDLVGHVAQFDASRVIATDGHLIPTGKLLNVGDTALDFRKAKSIGKSCVGFDNCWIHDKVKKNKPVFSIWSNNSGIRLDVTTNQPALQANWRSRVYTCNGIFNASLPIPRKTSQGGPNAFYENHSCVVIEQESWIDAINNPEFHVNQIYAPGRDYNWEATYAFSTIS
ncbi:galactose mutarotase-like protein [Panus rudis PR-1116 ss-1]|nr:galactose mutarotase-like protein [Panus rudis PR-1116 ss-1]